MPLINDVFVNGLVAGATGIYAHGVEQNGVLFTPDTFISNIPHALTVTACTTTNVSLRNDDPQDTFTGFVRCIKMHSEQTPAAITAVGALLEVVAPSTDDKTKARVEETRSLGTCMSGRLMMANAGGGGAAIAATNTVRIGADTYEFVAASPPLLGTAGRIFVFNGANVAASRTNFIDAVNGVVDIARISRTAQVPTCATNTELVRAFAGVTAGVINVVSAETVGGINRASNVQLLTGETLADAPDVWDSGSTHCGIAIRQESIGYTTVALNAAMIAKGDIQIQVPFSISGGGINASVIVRNRSRPQVEAVTTGVGYIQVILAGGGAPNNVDGDVLDIMVMSSG
jgi:uncharacterized membrane protein